MAAEKGKAMENLIVRQAGVDDAEGISEVLREIAAAGKRSKPCDPEFAKAHYVAHPEQIKCHVALSGARILGFQSLKRAVENNPYGAPVDWGVIGTHVRPSAARQGIGRCLFEATLEVARAIGLPAIDATIAATNLEGLAYYAAMGFIDYRSHDDSVCKTYSIS